MPIETGIWRLEKDMSPLDLTGIDLEKRLEDIISAKLCIVDPELMQIGRQVPTDFGGHIDILAIDADGNLTIIELKRDKTPREVVAQLLDYASWVRRLTSEAIAKIFIDYQQRFLDKKAPEGIDAALKRKYETAPDELNSGHRLLIVAGELDPSTERIVAYLQEQHAVDINVAFFRAFEDEGREYLTRTWLTEPDSLANGVSSSSAKREWNGEYHVTFREDDGRKWNDAKRHGFVSAGGGEKYVGPLRKLQPGDRIWVHVPTNGYAGVGEVLAPAVRPDEFMVHCDGVSKPLSGCCLEAPKAFDEEQGEHFVAVCWKSKVEELPGVWERGFYSAMGIVTKPRSPKWIFTIDRLSSLWGIK